jgi:hypothetical protein
VTCKFSIIRVSNNKWTDLIKSSYQYDFYQTQFYSSLQRNGEPILCVAFMNDTFIALPLIVRRIDRTNYFDCTSAYGYCGPVSNLPFETVPIELIKYFQVELLNFFEKKDIITAFSRLHPLFSQTPLFADFGIVKETNKTVVIDLRTPQENQIKCYRRSTKSEINQLKRKGYVVVDSKSSSMINEFHIMYNNIMKSKGADPSLIYDKGFFHKFLNNISFETKLLLALKGDIITAAAIFTFTNKIIQYHLACSKEEYKNDAPMKLILDHARTIGNRENMDFLHLGGGLSGSSDDSLFRFKAGFSNTRLTFSTWQLVIDETLYSKLCDLFNTDINKSTNFFPLYRIK